MYSYMKCLNTWIIKLNSGSTWKFMWTQNEYMNWWVHEFIIHIIESYVWTLNMAMNSLVYDKLVIYCQLADRHCCLVTEEVFKITLHKKKALTPNFQNRHFSTVCPACPGWLQCIASAMQGLPALQNHLNMHKTPFPNYACWVIQVVGPNLEIPFCTQQCSGKTEICSCFQ